MNAQLRWEELSSRHFSLEKDVSWIREAIRSWASEEMPYCAEVRARIEAGLPISLLRLVRALESDWVIACVLRGVWDAV